MKILFNSRQGSTLLVSLIAIVLLGFLSASYLDLVSNQNQATARSQQWNASIPVLEAGIEEALTQLYHHPTNLTANDWNLQDGAYRMERNVGDAKYVVTISDANPPVIRSQAYVRIPLTGGYIDPPRTVQVTVTNAALFAKGMVAKGQIELNGNNIKTDSFDSVDPNHSTNGRYDPAKSKDNGDVATNSAVIDSLDVWNAKIYGKASTGPGGTVKIGPNGAVGSKAWHDAGNDGIEPGWSNDDMNVEFPDVEPPFTGGASTPTSGSVGGTNYNYLLTGGNWQLDALSLAGQDKILVTDDAVLYVTGDLSMTGNSTITISTNASLMLYVGGSSASLSGGGIMNDDGNAMNFHYYGLPNNTSLSFGGNANFIGVIYAPAANFHLGGGGSNTYDFVGASITGTVRMNGHFNFHYDENMGRIGPVRGFVVNSWNEIFNWVEL